MQSIIDRLRRLSLAGHAPDSRGPESGADISSLPCSECGEPAAAWEYRTLEVGGSTAIDGIPVCAAHATASSERTAAG